MAGGATITMVCKRFTLLQFFFQRILSEETTFTSDQHQGEGKVAKESPPIKVLLKYSCEVVP